MKIVFKRQLDQTSGPITDIFYIMEDLKISQNIFTCEEIENIKNLITNFVRFNPFVLFIPAFEIFFVRDKTTDRTFETIWTSVHAEIYFP